MQKNQNFTRGKLFLPLLRFALPTLAASFLHTMYGAVDMWVVGRFATPADVSAISTGSWIMTLITSFVMGVAVGLTVLLGMRLGEGRADEAGGLIGAGIRLFALMSLLITAAVELLTPAIVRWMRVPPEAVAAATAYVRICGGGSVFIVAYNVLGSIFRGMGNSTMPLISVAIACVVNIAGDLLLVAVFEMAAAGAAIATVFAQAVSVLLSLAIISRQKLPFTLRAADLRRCGGRGREIFRLGFPVALQDLLVILSFLVLTAIVNALGVVISAGVGVAEKLCGFVMLAPSAFSQTMTAAVSQNIGAGQPRRARMSLRYGILASLAVGSVMSYLSFFHGDLAAGVFSRDAAVVAAAAQYLRAYAVDTLIVSVMFCMIGYFNGCGKTGFSMLQGILGAFCVRIPAAYFLSRLQPVNLFYIGLATPASSLVQTALCLLYYIRLSRRDRAAERVPAPV